MARSFNGSSDRAERTSASPITAYPFTLSCWVRTSNSTASLRDPFSLGNSGTADRYALFQVSTGHLPVYAVFGNTTGASITGGATINDGAWHHLLAVSRSATDHQLYVDGSSAGTSSTNIGTAPTLNVVSVGRLNYAGSGIQYFPGDVAEPALWTADASALAATLAKGVSPLLIRPQSLAAYWPLIGRVSPEPDLRGAYSLTLTGTSQADHPRVHYPGRRKTVFVPGAGGSGGEISGSASVTLDALVQSATGTLALTGAAGVSLTSTSLSSAGTVAITGEVGATFNASTATATGTLNAAGDTDVSLGILNLTSAGTLAITGILTKSLDGLGGTRTGTLPIGGVLTKTLAGLAGTRTGTLAVNGTLTKTLTDLSHTVTGALTVNGILAQTLSGLGGTRTGVLFLNGALVKTLGTASISSFGVATSGGNAVVTLTDLGRVITGTIPLNGVVIRTFGNTTTNGVGTVAIQGSVIKVLVGLSKSVTGTLTVGGILTQTFSPTTLSSIAQAQITASLAQTMAPVSRTIAGLLNILGITSHTLSSVTNTATGTLPIVGDAAELLNAAALTSTGTVPLNGAVTTLLSPLELWGVGAIPVIATLSQFTAGLDRTIYGTGLDQIGSDLVVTLAPAVLRSTYVDINAGPWQWVVRTSLGKFVAQRVTPPPYNLVADAVMGGVSLNWVLVLGYPYVKNIVIERSVDNVTFTTLETVPGAPTMYADVTTVPGSVYYYRIRALGNQLSSGLSDTVEVTA